MQLYILVCKRHDEMNANSHSCRVTLQLLFQGSFYKDLVNNTHLFSTRVLMLHFSIIPNWSDSLKLRKTKSILEFS